MNEPLAMMASPQMGFFSLIILGGLAGWIAGMITGMRHGILTNILIGIAGSYVGASLADVAGVAVRGSLMHLAAAIVGAVVVVFIWQMLRGERTA